MSETAKDTTSSGVTPPATIEGQVEYELFMIAGDLTKELNKLGADGWVAIGIMQQPPDAAGVVRLLVPCHRPKRLIHIPGANGVVLLN